ncbi:AAA family ATPase [Burkholderia dolosa]|uniref:AAA family ATPase n=1 Tax=Burkholderia dolosa TaxID=152500 RepID=UPI001BA0742D|nr:AAA family ATPase [Burkholderia dolosa]MBR8457584.1 AAA family ATPase [Burkholderia dolosa]MDN7421996.1 AAA family ATPase [Burkholderia dolosa]
MRLRYLHLSHYPPLADLAVAFSPHAPWAAFEPQGGPARLAIHFVIGQNGSGKSHLLRALAESFLALADERLPRSPVSLVYELGRPGEPGHRTLIFDCPGEAHATSLWQAVGWAFPDTTDREAFAQAITYLRAVERTPAGTLAVFKPRIARGDYPQGVPDALPRALLAYTSGWMDPWRAAWQPPVDGEALDVVTQSPDHDPSQERPPGWTEEDEASVVIEGGRFGDETARTVAPAEADTAPADLFRRPLLLEPVMLSAALLAVALQEAEAHRHGPADSALADLFRKAGWHCLVGVRLRVDLDHALAAPRALVERVHDAVRLGECLAEPHPGKALRSLYFDSDGAFPPNANLRDTQRYAGLTTQGQALHALLGEPDDTAFERFGALLGWWRHGVLEDIELFIRRNDKPDESLTGPSDPGVLRLSEFSDGERLVLARCALFHLLAGQDDALLLLDEPETHFNDAWKREIVQVVDTAMGTDASQVLIATHSAIVLSDVFDEEVVLIRKASGQSTAEGVPDHTFATDPSALMMTVFGAEDSIGARAQQRIEAFLRAAAQKTDPTPDDVRQLQALIRRLGTGFYRTELQTLLNRWQQAPDLRAIEQVIPTLQPDALKDELRALILKAREANGSAEGSDA